MKKAARCVYCGKEGQMTREHVIAKSIYSGRIKNAIIVPSHVECNNSFSMDEEYLRNKLTMWAADYSVNARKLLFSKVKRSMLRRPALGRTELEKMDLVNIYTPGGIYTGPKTRMKVTLDDWRRIYRVLDKIIKGLIFHKFRSILPCEYSIKHSFIDKRNLPSFIKKLESINLIWNMDNWKDCSFGYYSLPDSYRSVWVLVFYSVNFFQSLVSTKEDFARAKERLD